MFKINYLIFACLMYFFLDNCSLSENNDIVEFFSEIVTVDSNNENFLKIHYPDLALVSKGIFNIINNYQQGVIRFEKYFHHLEKFCLFDNEEKKKPKYKIIAQNLHFLLNNIQWYQKNNSTYIESVKQTQYDENGSINVYFLSISLKWHQDPYIKKLKLKQKKEIRKPEQYNLFFDQIPTTEDIAYFKKLIGRYDIKSIILKQKITMSLVTGSNKVKALHEVLEGEYNPDLYPSQIIKPVKGELHWFLDEAAAAGIKH